MAAEAPRGLKKALTLREAVALYFGSVLGTGVLVSPPLAAMEAGPASLWVWLAFSLISYPVALTLGLLAVRRPSAGGVSVFVGEAFGRAPGTAAGWLFLSAFTLGAPTAALVGANYLVPSLGLDPQGPEGRITLFGLAALLIALTALINYLGVAPSGRTQFVVMMAVTAFLVVVIVAGFRRFDVANLTPLAPRDLPSLGAAGAIIFWSFLGWENAVHAAEEFQDVHRDLRKAVAVSVLLIGVLYFLLGLVTVGARAYYSDPSLDALAFALLLRDILGRAALIASGILAFLVTVATINAYTLGVSRLVYGMARVGALPGGLAVLHPRTQVPHRSLGLLLCLALGALGLVAVLNLDYTTLFILVGASFIFLYLLAAGAASRLLAGKWLKGYALFTLGFFMVFLALLGLRQPVALLYPGAAVLLALTFLALTKPSGSVRGDGV